ncbi:30S ribosomal protein S17e [Candidatus Woesearchaeota archaeon]|nr:30S ribosomal protein S17e [Candidatus Woesearchaeota archaeon]
MGRIKTTLCKRTSNELMDLYGDQFTEDFNANKVLVSKFIETTSKKLRNVIAGYITRLVRKQRAAA